MRKRILLKDFGSLIDYKLEGYKTIYSCTKLEWYIYLLKEKLIGQGALEEDIKELESLVYSSAQEDAAGF